MTRTQTRLLTIGIPHPAASIIDLSARHPLELPVGSDNEDLVCGACGTVALANWSRSSTAERLVVSSQMLIRCGRCRAYNVVPTARLAEEPREPLAMVPLSADGTLQYETNRGADDASPSPDVPLLMCGDVSGSSEGTECSHGELIGRAARGGRIHYGGYRAKKSC